VTGARDLLEAKGLVKRFGGLTAVDRVDFDAAHGEVHAVIGPNGAGKTTFISLLSGEMQPDEGSVVFNGVEMTRSGVASRARAGLGRSYQVSQIFRDMTALQNVMLAIQAKEKHSFSFLKAVATDQALVDPARQALELTGLGHRVNALTSEMAHGEHRQLELAMTLATNPRLLLLDEPMAGMSRAESSEMVKLLKRLKADYAMILVEHDMDAVFSLAERVSVLVYGRIIASGTPDEIRSNAAVREAYLGDQEAEAV
jgi:branched-chain amino acid transport system ATP-binding protein